MSGQTPGDGLGAAGPVGAGGVRRNCSFCAAPTDEQRCTSCHRDTTALRRPCQRCGRMVPSRDPRCWHCGAQFESELRWKVPLIILFFVLAIILSIVLHNVR